MGSPGRPNDPPHRRRPVGSDPDDWDWGDEDAWDGPSRPDRPAPPREPEPVAARPRPAGPGGSGPRRPHGPDRPSGPPGPPPPDDRRTAALRRRRILLGAGALVGLLVAILVASSIASGGDGDDQRTASVPLLGDAMNVAATTSADHLQRIAAVQRFAALGEPVYCGAGKKPWVALTYDDGPGELSPKFMALLSKERIPVTVFRVGRVVPGNERYVEAQRNLGWESGTHTQNHPDLTTLGADGQRREIVAGNDASQKVLGRRPDLFRPPYQAHNATTDKIIKDLGMVQVLWNVDTQDSLGPTTAAKVAQNAIDGLKPGSIILMHEIKGTTYEAMPAIIKAMRERDLEPVTVSQMLAGDPPSEQQLKDGYAGCLTREAAGPGEENRPGEVPTTEGT